MDALRRLVPLAPVPGAVLAAAAYGIDPGSHLWASYVVVAGWWLLVAGLVLIEWNQVTRWMALIAALGFLASPSNPGSAETALFAIGFVTAAALVLVTMTTYVVRTETLVGRIVSAAALTVVGVGGLLSFGFPDSPYLNNPATQIWAVLVVSPPAIGFGVLWLALDVPPTPRLAQAGPPAAFLRRFLGGLVGWVSLGIAVSALSSAGGPVAAASYPVCVILLQVLPTALWGRTFGQLCAGLRVVRVDTGEAPGWLRSFVRFAVFQSVPLLGLIYFVAWGTQARMGLGRGMPERLAWDRASGTAVVRVSRKQAVELPART